MRTRMALILVLSLLLAACNLPVTTTPVPPTATPLPPTETPIPPTETPILPTETPSSPVIGWVPMDFRMFNATNGWGVDYSGYLLRTTDGGWNWLDSTPAEIAGTGRSFSVGYYVDQALWVMPASEDPESGRLLRTLDGGATWTAFDIPFGWGQLSVVDETHLYALAGYGGAAGSHAVALWGSTDGGATWGLLADARPNESLPDTLPFGGAKTGVAAADSQHLTMTGSIPMDNYTYVYASPDGGVTWERQELYLPVGALGNMQTTFNPPLFFVDGSGVMFAMLYTMDNVLTGVYVTPNGGESWSYIGAAPHPGVTAATDAGHFFVMGETQFSVGVWGADPEVVWMPVLTDLPAGFWPAHLQFIDPLNGWLSLELAGVFQIYRTSDGGQTWTLLAEAGG